MNSAPAAPAPLAANWKQFGILILVILVIAVIVIIMKLIVKARAAYPSRQNNEARAMEELMRLSPVVDLAENNRRDYMDALKDVPEDERALSNFYVLGCRLTGYIGPEAMNGIFATHQATLLALRAGARVLVLDIDYLDKERTVPRLVCRDRAGYLLSNNTGAISDVADAIAEYKARSMSPSDPIILVLNVLRLPDGARSAESLKFMENIARGLGAITKHLLRQTSKGTYYGRRMEDVIFRQRITEFDNKVIVITNADTAGFRSPPQTFTVDVRANLDNIIHARIYGNAVVPETGVIPGARMETPIFYTDLPADRRKTYSDAAMKEFTIALGDDAFPEVAPTDGTLVALSQLGVQCIPVNIFACVAAADDKETPIYSDKYFKKISYIAKEAALRYKEDKVITVKAPAASLNANGGRIEV